MLLLHICYEHGGVSNRGLFAVNSTTPVDGQREPTLIGAIRTD